MITSLDYKSVTLQPQQVRPVSVTGSVFSCLTATAEFQVSIDGGPFLPFRGGLQVDNRPNLFTSVIFQNLSATAITLEFYCGTCAVTYSPVTTQTVETNAATYPKGTGDQSIGGGASIPFSGLDQTTFPGLTKVRKQIIIENLDAAAKLQLLDGAGGKSFLDILAGETKTVELSGACWLYNPNGGAVSYCVGEIFYA